MHSIASRQLSGGLAAAAIVSLVSACGGSSSTAECADNSDCPGLAGCIGGSCVQMVEPGGLDASGDGGGGSAGGTQGPHSPIDDGGSTEHIGHPDADDPPDTSGPDDEAQEVPGAAPGTQEGETDEADPDVVREPVPGADGTEGEPDPPDAGSGGDPDPIHPPTHPAPPTVTIIEPRDAQWVTGAVRIRVEIRSDAGLDEAALVALVDGEHAVALTRTGTDTFEGTFDSLVLTEDAASPVLEVTARDVIGQQTRATRRFAVDNAVELQLVMSREEVVAGQSVDARCQAWWRGEVTTEVALALEVTPNPTEHVLTDSGGHRIVPTRAGLYDVRCVAVDRALASDWLLLRVDAAAAMQLNTLLGDKQIEAGAMTAVMCVALDEFDNPAAPQQTSLVLPPELSPLTATGHGHGVTGTTAGSFGVACQSDALTDLTPASVQVYAAAAASIDTVLDVSEVKPTVVVEADCEAHDTYGNRVIDPDVELFVVAPFGQTHEETGVVTAGGAVSAQRAGNYFVGCAVAGSWVEDLEPAVLRIVPGLPAAWEVAAPVADCSRGGRQLPIGVTVYDTWTNEVPSARLDVTTHPTGGVVQEDARYYAGADGHYDVRIALEGDQAPESSIVPHEGELLVDSHPPRIVIDTIDVGGKTTPMARGATILAGGYGDVEATFAVRVEDELSPIASVFLDGVEMAAPQGAATASFSVTHDSRWGLSVIDGRAADSCGNVGYLAHAYLRSPAFYSAATVEESAAAAAQFAARGEGSGRSHSAGRGRLTTMGQSFNLGLHGPTCAGRSTSPARSDSSDDGGPAAALSPTDPDAVVSEAFVARIGQQALDDGHRPSLNDVASIAEAALRVTDWNAQAPGCEVLEEVKINRGCGFFDPPWFETAYKIVRAPDRDIILDVEVRELTVVEGGVAFDLWIDEFELPLLADVRSCMGFGAWLDTKELPVSVGADWAHFTGTMKIERNGAVTAVDVKDLVIDTGGPYLCNEGWGQYRGLCEDIQDYVLERMEETLEDMMEDAAAPQLAQAVRGFFDDFEVLQTAVETEEPVAVALYPLAGLGRLQFRGPTGSGHGDLAVWAQLGPPSRGLPAAIPARGAIRGPDVSADFAFGAGQSFGVALKIDLLNQLFWALWYGGVFEVPDALSLLEDAEEEGGGENKADPMAGVEALGLSASLPLVLMPKADLSGTQAGIGDLKFTATLNVQEALGSVDFPMEDVDVPLETIDVEGYISFMAGGQIGLDADTNRVTIDFDSQATEAYVQVTFLQMPYLEGPVSVLLTEVFQRLVPQLLEKSAPSLPIPDFDISETVGQPKFLRLVNGAIAQLPGYYRLQGGLE